MCKYAARRVMEWARHRACFCEAANFFEVGQARPTFSIGITTCLLTIFYRIRSDDDSDDDMDELDEDTVGRTIIRR